MNIESIEIFSQLDADNSARVEALFTEKPYEEGDVILTYGKPVDGLFLVAEGEVAVSIPAFEGTIAELGAGHSFGELSLFNQDDQASATVTVCTPSAVIHHCPRERLMVALAEDEALAAGFYQGCALMMAGRLRATNEKISGDIADIITSATGLVDEITSGRQLGSTRDEVLFAGTSIVSGMTEIVKKLLVMKQTEQPVPPEQIAVLADKAKDIYYGEFQIFDRITQQLHLLQQHMDNVKRILHQQDVVDIEVDDP